MVSKIILTQYTDLTEEIKEVRNKIDYLENEICKIEEQGTVFDSVTGGYGGTQRYKIEGFPYPEYTGKKKLLYERKETLMNLENDLLKNLNDIEKFINTVEDSRIRRIINLRFVENLSWNKVADRIGGGNTEDSVRMAFNRFMEK